MDVPHCPVCGNERVGTIETISGRCLITGVNADGTVEVDGETKVFWDTSTSKTFNGLLVLECTSCLHEFTVDGIKGVEGCV